MRILPSTRAERWRLVAFGGILVVLGLYCGNQLLFLLSRAPVLYYYLRYTPQEGDVVFQSLPPNDLAEAIEGITHSPYSHCGVVLRNKNGNWVVIESIFNVHETPLFLWELRGQYGMFDVYRLDAAHAPLIPEFKRNLLSYTGWPYDDDYDMTNGSTVYCSDLVYLAFDKTCGEKMGRLEKLGDLDWKPYEEFIKSDQRGKLPLDRVMITPASLARAPQLKEVYKSGF